MLQPFQKYSPKCKIFVILDTKRKIGRNSQMRKTYVTLVLVVLQAVANDVVRTSVVLADTTVMGTDNAGYWDEAW